ncbi:MAG: hypothetical protein JF597_12890 [Streptomyces sp.]|uniref:hypothetical protein n=1 Tax=Streptomyces sp. TaxID=1931 RepID=UPI0025FBBB35|nr:hypothetical protein [Streptomyces sp.]MBW8794453.1 hypothetical protein [Streptomyces sp.]
MNTSRRAAARWPGIAACAVVAVLATGCTDRGTAAGADVPASPSTGVPSVRPTPSATPSPSPTPPYPVNAHGCHPDKGWSRKQAAAWLQQEEDPTGKVGFVRSTAGFNGPLCEPITVQVQFWRLTYRSAAGALADGSESSAPDYYFTMAPMKHVEVRVDGRRDVAVSPPKGHYSSHRSPCVGGLVAFYTGGPLTEKELPSKIVSGDSILTFDSVEFHTNRVLDSKVDSPADPAVCDADGKPTAAPAPRGASSCAGCRGNAYTISQAAARARSLPSARRIGALDGRQSSRRVQRHTKSPGSASPPGRRCRARSAG